MGKNNRITKLGRVSLKINGLYSYFFKMPFVEIPYIEMARQEINEKPEMESSLYYQYLFKRTQEGIVFRRLTPEERFKEWRELADSMQVGYQETFEEYEEDFHGEPLLYGGLTGKLVSNGVELVDGHHRLSFLYVMGNERADIILFTNE